MTRSRGCIHPNVVPETTVDKGVADPAKQGQRGVAHPFINIHDRLDLRIQLRRWQRHRLTKRHQGGIVVTPATRADLKGGSVIFLAVPQVANVGSNVGEGHRRLEAFHRARSRVIGDIQIHDAPVTSVLELRRSEQRTVARHLQHRDPGVSRTRTDHVHEIVIHAGHPRVIEHVLDVHFIRPATNRRAGRAVCPDRTMHATE